VGRGGGKKKSLFQVYANERTKMITTKKGNLKAEMGKEKTRLNGIREKDVPIRSWRTAGGEPEEKEIRE